MAKHTRKLRTEQLEKRELLAADFANLSALTDDLDLFSDLEIAAIDGTGNNQINTAWGAIDAELLRLVSVEYGDGVSTPTGADRVSAREISNALADQDDSATNERGLTDLVWLWGQFIDHDLDLTENASPIEEFNIEVPLGDEQFDPNNTGSQVIGLNRSIYNTDADGIRQQINEITAFLDGSMVYGSDDERAAALRTFTGGQLKTSAGDLLPFNVDGLDNAGGPSDTLFLAGDVRANENAALSSMHTLWVREHNRLAEEIATANPSLTDEEIYQQARAIVRAEIQAITYNEFLPALLGEDAVSNYAGYDPTVNPGISNLFSTAAYRFGHSMLSEELLRLNNDGTVVDAGNLPLQEAFFSPQELVEGGIDSLLFGAANQLAQEVDTLVIDDVRNFLFGEPGQGGFDLASLNIQRGRDHGLADYNQARIDLGLEPVTSFDQITSNAAVAAELESLYGNVDNIDAWVGGLAEDHVEGSSVGELVQTVLVDQFERIRAGDRFWYQNVFTGRQLHAIEQTSLADVIMRNTDVTGLQENVFFEENAQEEDRQLARRDHQHRFDGLPPQHQGNARMDRGMPRQRIQLLTPMERERLGANVPQDPVTDQRATRPERNRPPQEERIAQDRANQDQEIAPPELAALDQAFRRMRFGRGR